MVAARFAAMPAAVRDRLGAAMARLGVALEAEVAANLSGGMLQQRSGRLAAAQDVQIDIGPNAVSVGIGFDPSAVPYGAIQLFGGTTRAHLIAARRAMALAFDRGGRLVFAKQVQHPGSVIPAHAFLGAALAAVAPDGMEDAKAAVAEAIQA